MSEQVNLRIILAGRWYARFNRTKGHSKIVLVFHKAKEHGDALRGSLPGGPLRGAGGQGRDAGLLLKPGLPESVEGGIFPESCHMWLLMVVEGMLLHSGALEALGRNPPAESGTARCYSSHFLFFDSSSRTASRSW